MRTRPQPDNSAYWWWERSPYSGASSLFCAVYSGGTANADFAGYTYGLAPFGCI